MVDNRSGMKRTIGLVAVIVAVLVSPLVRAEGSLTDAQLRAIEANCVDAQINIQRVQEADKLTRINRGYLYDSTLKLMVNFNSRVAQNKLDAPELISITSSFTKTLDDFRATFTTYDDTLTQLTHLECYKQPTTFNDILTSARESRKVLSMHIRDFELLLNRYQTTLDGIKQKLGGGV